MEKALSDIKTVLRFLVDLVIALLVLSLVVGILFGDVFGVFESVGAVVGQLNKDGFVGFLVFLAVSLLTYKVIKKE